jgi:hypothetical protein
MWARFRFAHLLLYFGHLIVTAFGTQIPKMPLHSPVANPVPTRHFGG